MFFLQIETLIFPVNKTTLLSWLHQPKIYCFIYFITTVTTAAFELLRLYLLSYFHLFVISIFLQETLQLRPVGRRDAGLYTCQAQNSVGTSEQLSVQLDVKCKLIYVNLYASLFSLYFHVDSNIKPHFSFSLLILFISPLHRSTENCLRRSR